MIKKREYFIDKLNEEKQSSKLLPITRQDERDFLSCPKDIKEELSIIRTKKILEQYPNGANIEMFDLGRGKKGFLVPKDQQEKRWLDSNYLIYSIENSPKRGCCPSFKINVLEEVEPIESFKPHQLEKGN